MIDIAPNGTPPRRRAALIFIFITVLIDILTFGLIIPVLPHLIENFLGGNVSQRRRLVRLFRHAFFAMQFIFTPMQGALSDRFGRRPVILLSNLGLGLDFLMMALVNTLPLLFIGRIISGITAASFSTANAYVADVTPPEKRAQAFGMIGMAFGLGFIIAPAIGGFLGAINVRLPFWVAVAMCLTNFAYGLFVLPESLPHGKAHADIRLGARQSARFAQIVAPLSASVGFDRSCCFCFPSRTWCIRRRSCCTPITDSIGARKWSVSRSRWSAFSPQSCKAA